MITIFGTTLGAVWPWLALGVPLIAGLLVYIFRARGVSEPLVTSTLFIIKRLPEDQPSRKNASFPLQFWLELLAFSLLALGASGLFVTQTGERVAVVIDTSKSMSAHLRQGETRLELARKLAAADIAQSGDDTRFAVFSATDTLTPHRANRGARNYQDQSDATQAVKDIQGDYLTDSLQPLVAQLTRSTEYDRVWIYSDYFNNTEGSSERLRLVSVLEQGDFEPPRNVWISSLKTIEDKAGRSWLEVGTSSSGSGTLKISPQASCGVGEALELEELPQIEAGLITLGGDLATKVGPLPAEWRYCRLELNPERADSLSLDDRAWIARPVGSSDQIKLFGPLSPEALGLSQIKFAPIVPADSALQGDLSGAIFHRAIPEQASPIGDQQRPLLVINPPEGAKIADFAEVNGIAANTPIGVEITRWDEAHPILRYLQPQLLNPPRANVLSCGEWGRPILFSSSGPIACAGEKDGRRLAVIGFEIFPFDGAKSAGVSILTLNLIKWVFDSNHLAGIEGAQVGVVSLPYEALSARLIAPEQVQISEQASRALRVAAPGVVLAERAVSDTVSQKTLLAVNSISSRESDLARRSIIKIESNADILASGGRIESKADRELRDRRDLWFVLTVAFLLVLAADSILRLFKRARRGGRS